MGGTIEAWVSRWRARLADIAACLGTRVGLVSTSLVVAPRFPGPGDFAGTISKRYEDARNGGQSTYEGSLAVTMFERGLVEKVLPQGLRLADQLAVSPDHPVIHLIGHQRDPRRLIDGMAVPPPWLDYQELILIVPFVQHGAGERLHNYVVWMYLNDALAIGIGNSVYAYTKRPARFDETTGADRVSMRVSAVFGGPVYFTSDVTLTGPWRSVDDAAAALPRIGDLRAIFELPMVGSDPLRLVCSYFEWDYAQAEVAPAVSSHRFHRPFREGMEGWVTVDPLTSAPDGALALRGLRWRLALPPPPCQF